MKENNEIVKAIEQAEKQGKRIALATVVRVIGSAYRREGAKMLINEDGKTVGVISGGCLESDVAETAINVIKTDKPLLKEYDMDEETVWGLGLGCPGRVQLYIEPLSEEEGSLRQGAFQLWTDCVGNNQPGILATVLSSDIGIKVGSRLFVSEKGQQFGSIEERELDEKVTTLARDKVIEIDPKSETYTFNLYGGQVTVYIDVHIPPAEVMIFGAGHDAIPVAVFAHQCGFRVTVIDQREAFASEERFLNTSIILARSEELEKKVQPGRRTFIIIMNHHLDRDRECLRFSLQSEAPYIGLLGPKDRCERLLRSLQEQGVTFSETELSHLHNPVGLDIGAEGSDEIAVSIISEVISHKHGRYGGQLRARSDRHLVKECVEIR